MKRAFLSSTAVIALLLLFEGVFSACSDDHGDTPDKEVPYPTLDCTQIQLTEVQRSDAQSVTYTQLYRYNEGRIVGQTAIQTFQAVEPVEMTSITTVEYDDREAIVTDEYGNKLTYTLNEEGYATACTKETSSGNLRYYTFSYQVEKNGEHYLTHIAEELETGVPYASVTLSFDDFYTLSIAQQIESFEQIYTAASQQETALKNVSEVPFLFLAELYPLSEHKVALYGKWLGEPFPYLFTSLVPANNEEGSETVAYQYTTDTEGGLTECHITTRSYGRKFNRTISYDIK